jgi:hypothetical protein
MGKAPSAQAAAPAPQHRAKKTGQALIRPRGAGVEKT